RRLKPLGHPSGLEAFPPGRHHFIINDLPCTPLFFPACGQINQRPNVATTWLKPGQLVGFDRNLQNCMVRYVTLPGLQGLYYCLGKAYPPVK
ncbi:MAG: hypothetical protein AB1453_15160, partial [Chloroflexota bacterium]